MIKVCHIISGDLWAGAEASAYQLLQGLSACPDLECTAIVLNEGKLADSIRKLHIPVSIFDETKMTFFQICLRLRSLFRHSSPHIVHSHGYKQNMLTYLASKAITGIHLLATQHGLPESVPGNRTLKERTITKLNFSALSAHFHVIAVSRDIRAALIKEHRIPENKVEVILNGILIPPIIPKSYEKKSFVVGSAGRLFPIKDYPFMVEVAKEVVQETKDVRFVLAGDGPELEKIRLLIQKHDLEKFFFLKGFIADIDSFYEGLDLYLNTSIHEGVPMSVLEAMARGVPVIAPKVGGFEEIIDDGIQGFLLEKRHPRDFTEKCLALYRNDLMRRKMGAAGREKIVMNFSVEHMTQQYRQAYMAL